MKPKSVIWTQSQGAPEVFCQLLWDMVWNFCESHDLATPLLPSKPPQWTDSFIVHNGPIHEQDYFPGHQASIAVWRL
jgi:hypothetical protein